MFVQWKSESLSFRKSPWRVFGQWLSDHSIIRPDLRTAVILSLLCVCFWLFPFLSLDAHAKAPCYKSSFNNGAGVSFVDKNCLNRLKRVARKKRRRARQNHYVLLQGKLKRKRKRVRIQRKRKRKRKQVRVRKASASRTKHVRLKKKQRRAAGKRWAKHLKAKNTKQVKRAKRTKVRENRQTIVQLQQLLKQENYAIGTVDGRMGGATKRALEDYRLKYNFKQTASLNAVLGHLRNRPISSITLPIAAPAIVAALPAQTAKAFVPSPQRGEKYARQCEGCHSFKAGEANKAGPNLYGVMGQFIGSAQHFNYSETLKFQLTLGNMWNKEEMDCFIKDPQGCKPGTTMSFNGIKSDRKRADLIAYLEQLGQ